MARLRALVVAVVALFALGPAQVMGEGAQREGVHVAIACGALGIELELCTEAASQWARETGNTVQIVNTPNSPGDRFQISTRRSFDGDSDRPVDRVRGGNE